MKTLFFIVFVCFCNLGFSLDKTHSHTKEKSISDQVESEVKQLKKQIEKLEKELSAEAKKKKENAQDTLEQAGDEARDLVKKGLNEVADGLSTLEKKVRKMADEK